MRRFALVFTILSVPVLAFSAFAASPAQLEAQRQVERDQRQDRVAEVARDLERGGPGAPALVDDMNRERPTLSPDRGATRGSTPQQSAGTSLPLLSDNAQR